MKLASSLCAALFCLACGVQPATTTPETYADFLKLSSQLSCEASLRCCGTVCTPTTDAAFYKPSTRALDYLNSGLLAYNRPAAVDCLTAMKQRYTDCNAAAVQVLPNDPCSNILSPKAPIGGVCESGINSCGADAICSNTSCTFRRATGEPCAPNNPFLCSSDQDSCCTFCSGLCSTGIRIGQPCSIGVATQCQAGAFCVGSPALCTAYAGAGQSCSDASKPCNPLSGLACLPPSQTCGPPQTSGAACTSGAHCMSNYCLLPNLPLLTQGTCQPHPVPVTVREQLCQSR